MARKQKQCRICRKNPTWKHPKQGMLDVCKTCYHKHVWQKPSKKKDN